MLRLVMVGGEGSRVNSSGLVAIPRGVRTVIVCVVVERPAGTTTSSPVSPFRTNAAGVLSKKTPVAPRNPVPATARVWPRCAASGVVSVIAGGGCGSTVKAVLATPVAVVT